jgi:hypothetical protein
MTRDDDDDDIPTSPADPADPAEEAHARAFGDLIDKVLAGRSPAAVPAEDRALLEVATVIRAAARPPELGTSKTRSIVESALATAIERRGGGRLTDPSVPVPGVVPIAQARARRAAPWVVAGVTSAIAAAAVVLLLLQPARKVAPPEPTAAVVPTHLRSRPADPLIGVIPPAPSLDAASGGVVSRIDTIYADRLAGFRERTLDGATRRQGKGSGGRP